jgi:hypothetical protein
MHLERSNLTNPASPAGWPTHEQVSRLAAQSWEMMGRPRGRDMEIWLLAERQLVASLPHAEGGNSTREPTQPAGKRRSPISPASRGAAV